MFLGSRRVDKKKGSGLNGNKHYPNSVTGTLPEDKLFGASRMSEESFVSLSLPS
jgi:hypothetical protein